MPILTSVSEGNVSFLHLGNVPAEIRLVFCVSDG